MADTFLNILASILQSDPQFIVIVTSDVVNLIGSFINELRGDIGLPTSEATIKAQQTLFGYDQTIDIPVGLKNITPNIQVSQWSPEDWLNFIKALVTAQWTILDYGQYYWCQFAFNNPRIDYVEFFKAHIEPILVEKMDILWNMEFDFPKEKFGWEWNADEFGAPIYTTFGLPLPPPP